MDYAEMKEKLRRDGMAEQKAKFNSTAGTPAQTSMRYGSMTDAEEKAAAAKPAPMLETAQPSEAKAPTATVRGVPEEMTAEAYPGIPQKPDMGTARRTTPTGPVPTVEDKPDVTTAFGLRAPVAKMMRDNGMSPEDADKVAYNIVEIYKQTNDKQLGSWLRDVAHKQTASTMTNAEKWRNAMFIGSLMAGGATGAGGLIAGAPLAEAVLGGLVAGTFTGIPGALKADSEAYDEWYAAREKARAAEAAKQKK